MTKIRINDGDYAGYLRETLGSQGTQAGGATTGSPILNEAQAAVAYNYVPPTPPVLPPSGFKFYRIGINLAARKYLSEVEFCLTNPYNVGQIVMPASVLAPTSGGNLTPGALIDGVWPSPFWSSPTPAEEANTIYLMFTLAQAFPIRLLRFHIGGGGPEINFIQVGKSNDENGAGLYPYVGKAWTDETEVYPTWNAMPNGWADVPVAAV